MGIFDFFQQQPDPLHSLLGQYYDPNTARMKWLGGTLQGVGAGLAGGQPGAWAQGAILGGGEALDNYRKQAAVANQIAMNQEDQAWQNKAHARQESAWNLEDQQIKARDAWQADPTNKTLFAQAYPDVYAREYAQSLFPNQNGGGGSSNWGMQVVPLRDKRSGKLVAGQFNSGQGGLFVDGQPADPSQYEYDPGGLAQDRSYGGTVGKAQGGAASSLPGEAQNVQWVKSKIDDILSDPSLPDNVGWNSYRPDWASSNSMIAFRTKMAELDGAAFLQARQMLKGGGAITDFESQKAEAAYNAAKVAIQSSDPQALKDALTRFKEAIDAGYAKLQAQAGQTAPSGGAPAPQGDNGGYQIEEVP